MEIESAVELRRFIYRVVLETGRPPKLHDISSHFNVSAEAARSSVGTLRIGKTVLPHPKTGEIWMAGPFSSEPTGYRVYGSCVSWWANCAWDMLGIPMIAHEPVRIETRCTDCGEPIEISASPDTPPASGALVHFLVPARDWYKDIGFT